MVWRIPSSWETNRFWVPEIPLAASHRKAGALALAWSQTSPESLGDANSSSKHRSDCFYQRIWRGFWFHDKRSFRFIGRGNQTASAEKLASFHISTIVWRKNRKRWRKRSVWSTWRKLLRFHSFFRRQAQEVVWSAKLASKLASDFHRQTRRKLFQQQSDRKFNFFKIFTDCSSFCRLEKLWFSDASLAANSFSLNLKFLPLL